jgi:uncharacterized repeat protein (TIGR01451 family)
MKTAKTKNAKRALLSGLCACVALLLAIPAGASAAQKWRITSISNTTAQPGDILDYRIEIDNVGDQAMDGSPIVLTATLPPGLSVADRSNPVFADPNSLHFSPFNFELLSFDNFSFYQCTGPDGLTPLAGGESEVRCQNSVAVPSHVGTAAEVLTLPVEVDPGAVPGQVLESHLEVSGGGAPAASTVDPVRVSAEPPGFGIDAFDAQFRDATGAPFTAAGRHPDELSVPIDLNTLNSSLPIGGPFYPAAPLRDAVTDLPPGLIGNPSAFPRCTADQLANGAGLSVQPLCPAASQLGGVTIRFNSASAAPYVIGPFPLFNMVPSPGSAARFGFNVFGTVVVIDVQLRFDGEYRIVALSRQVSEGLALAGFDVNFWGRPGDAAHNPDRACPGSNAPFEGGSTCAGNDGSFLRMPTSCTGQGLPWGLHMDSWKEPGALSEDGAPDLSDPAWKSATLRSHQLPGYPFPSEEWGGDVGLTGCDVVPVKGDLDAKPTALDTETSSGLAVHVEIPNDGLTSSQGISSSDIEGVKVTLPQGVTINPSQAEGLGVCSPAQYESSQLSFHPDGQHGCPSDSKIGTVQTKTPLLEETVPGSVYVAKPYDNPFNSLLALYIVLEEPQRGLLVKLAGEVRTNEQSGRIEAEFDHLPQAPFSTFDFHFREGARAPLITPPTCGTYTTEAVLTPWSDPSRALESDSSFQIIHGIGGGPCPPNGTPAFKPHFSAGSINNNAGSYSPFNMRIQRNDGEQDMTRFSAVLPPGELGKLAGVAKCPDSAIAAAKAKSGLEEIASPSCPAGSEIGRSLVGAGVGSVLTYVPGKVYLAGPFAGDPLSVIAITPAVAGPFDVGTVVVHEALTLNPKTAEVEVDGAASDPIPHILKGVPAKLRDLRVYVDRQNFTLNPTSCDPSSTKATLFGGGGDAFSSADDVPVLLSDRYQAANCAALGFKPKLALDLKGGTRRGGHPGLTATYRPRSGDANAKGLVVRLPRSAFLDQAHIRTICTRVQFAAKSCPKGAQYGYIKAWSPLLEEPLAGPVYLRSSDHKLPDLVFDLHGLVDVEVASRIDSVKGGIRATVEQIPDAPLTKVILQMQGAKKGLIVNSRNLCGGANRAKVDFEGQNGKMSDFDPVLGAECGKRRRVKSN